MATDAPNTRPAEPDHPMELCGGAAEGNPDLMARCMVEEMLLSGIAPDELDEMTRNRFYQALYAARRVLGDQRMDQILRDASRRIGRHHHRTLEHKGSVAPAKLTVSSETARRRH